MLCAAKKAGCPHNPATDPITMAHAILYTFQGAFSYVFTEATPGLTSTVLELPEVCRSGESIKTQQSASVQERVKFVELDATSPNWPVDDTAFDVVLMSYISGSVRQT